MTESRKQEMTRLEMIDQIYRAQSRIADLEKKLECAVEALENLLSRIPNHNDFPPKDRVCRCDGCLAREALQTIRGTGEKK